MEGKFKFTFSYILEQFEEVISNGYRVITCAEYVDHKKFGQDCKILVNRVDIDFSVKKAARLIDIFNKLEIKATFFLRLHAPEYNPFAFENYRIIKFAIESGHELGYHSEVIDQAAIWDEDAADCLRRDIELINRTFGVQIVGAASHGGSTGLNNLDFWKDRKPADFGLLYEAYDCQPEYNLFNECFYISDSEWTRWKCYNRGELVKGDLRSLGEHAKIGYPLMHSLIHSDTYFDRHFYE